MMDKIASFTGRMAKIEGPARSGKTEALLQRAAALIAAGTSPSELLLATSTAEGARQARIRLAQILEAEGVEAAHDQVQAMALYSVRDLIVNLLSTPEAQEATGRTPRMVAPFEYNFFLEDMKTTGLPNRRLRSLLTRFSQQWCANAEEADWVVPGDEGDALTLVHELMDSYHAMLEDEAAYICARYLQSEAGSSVAKRYAVVLADDFQNASAAQQQCLCLLARDQLLVAGNPNETIPCATSWPCPEGFAQFDSLRRGVELFKLDTTYGNPNVSAFCDALAKAPSMDSSLVATHREGAIRDCALLKWNCPDDEFNGLTRYLRVEADRGALPVESSISVVAPNKQWAAAFEAMLTHRGFTVSSLGFETIGGDPRTFGRCKAMMAYTALNLLATPDDPFAWRLWCGYGNYLTLSDGWASLRDWCAQQGCTAQEALAAAKQAKDQGGEEPFLRAFTLAERYEAAQELLERAQGRRGFALLNALEAQELPEFARVCAQMAGDEDAATIFGLIKATQFAPTHSANPHAIHLNSYQTMAGTNYEAVYAVGCVDGFMPGRDAFEVVSTEEDRTRLKDEDRRAFMAAAGKAAETLLFSTFPTADLELAERTKMRVMRVRMGDEGRIALVRPTSYLEEAGAATPLTLGGQAVLADLA